MTELIAMVQDETDDAISEKPILRTLRAMYPDADISLQSSKGTHIYMEGRDPIPLSQIESGLWEDTEYIDDFIEKSNNEEFPFTRAVRAIAAQCENVSGPSLLIVATKNFQLVFDDIDSWFVQTCADMYSKIWHKHILAEVVETKEKFLRGFSHQLRTPLHGIIGSVEMLAEELGVNNLRSTSSSSTLLESKLPIDSRGPIAHLEIIRTAGRDLVSIVNSMITLNRWADIAMRDRHHSIHTTLELEKTLANEIMKTLSGDTRYTASIFFNHHLPSDCDTIRIDLELLRDSLLPLVINAIQNTPGGIVTITTSLIPESKQLIVDIEDNGRGIHPDHQSRIFDPYERAGAHSTGAGLGLTLSSKFAALLHGSVALVYSNLNNGSHFKATFCQIEHFMLPSPSQLLASKLNALPSRFYNMTFDWDTPSLSNIFAKYLIYNKFVNSNSMNDCFAIVDYVPDVEQRRASLSQFPSDQVILCFIPASENFKCLEDTPNNVIYVRGPFLTSTMISALEAADELVSSIKPSIECLVKPCESTLTLQEMDNNPEPDQRQISTTDSSSQTVWPRQPPTGSPIASNPDISVSSNYQTERKSSIDPRLVIPPSSSLKNSPRPTSLLVDDNDINLRILQMYCNKRGLPYCCATDGFEALNAFSCYQSSPVAVGRAAIQLVIMDLQMPGCDGIEATRQIRLLEKQNKWRECVVFIVTGQDSPADRKAAENAGADEYFVKPVGIKLLDRSVKQYFDAFEIS
jgi:signal transduction histidine kinase/CheY-like chemotaxis protein